MSQHSPLNRHLIQQNVNLDRGCRNGHSLVDKTGKTLRDLLQRKGLGQRRNGYLWAAEHCCKAEGAETAGWHLCPPVQHVPQTEPSSMARDWLCHSTKATFFSWSLSETCEDSAQSLTGSASLKYCYGAHESPASSIIIEI